MGHKRLIGGGKGSALAVAFISVLILLSAVILVDLSRRGQPLGLDFAPIWAAATDPVDAYDVQAITGLQSRLFGIDLVPRPYAYPPTTLLLLLPFGWLGFWHAYAAFVAIGSILFVLALRSGSVSLWAFAFPPIFILLHVGQLSLLAGSLLLLALASSNCAIRGTLFALAIALKPQLALFLPLLLVLQRDWRSAALAFALFCLFVAGSASAFGLGLWKDWVQSLRDLVQVVNANPTLAAHQISGSWLFLPVSLIAVWVARKADAATQLALIVGAALLVSPYAMNYELGLLVPALARCGFEKDKPTAAVALILATWSILFLLPVLLITLGFLIWRTWAGDALDAGETATSSPSHSEPPK
jgi:hypothetical protein